MNKINNNPKPLIQPVTTDNPYGVLRGGHYRLREYFQGQDNWGIEKLKQKDPFTAAGGDGFRIVKNQ